jgi:prolyl 4-hydroxylase
MYLTPTFQSTNPDIPVPHQYKDMPLQPLGDRSNEYLRYLNGCIAKFGNQGKRCANNEYDRIAMSLRQPQSMTNYTSVGYKKIKAPPELFRLVKEFWDANNNRKTLENWGIGNTYTNNWESPTYMVSVENTNLRGGGPAFKQHLWDLARDTIQVGKHSFTIRYESLHHQF